MPKKKLLIPGQYGRMLDGPAPDARDQFGGESFYIQRQQPGIKWRYTQPCGRQLLAEVRGPTDLAYYIAPVMDFDQMPLILFESRILFSTLEPLAMALHSPVCLHCREALKAVPGTERHKQ